MNQRAIVGQHQHARGVLVQAPHRLHALHRTFLRAVAQRRWQQGVQAGPRRWLVRALVACGFVQQHIGFGVVRPQHALHRVMKAFVNRHVFKRVITGGQAVTQIDLDVALLNEARTNTACAKTLGIQNILQLHGSIVN